ncbi:hypothetical protein [Acrocarpospora catenulata]|uniref:hypothetical protein n=1 Tax=Acrocarpospora catenulata TaxID=2836182 RepID=UPI001BDA7DAA|nr:hypothetical protein [Acrocarpospora catenulata]
MTRTATKAALWAITALAALITVSCDDGTPPNRQAETSTVSPAFHKQPGHPTT